MGNSAKIFYGKPQKAHNHDFNGTPVTTAAWVQLIASMDKAISTVEIYNSSGSILELGLGSAGNEVSIPYYILPNGSLILLPIEIAFGQRLSAKAVNQDATVGELVLNFLG